MALESTKRWYDVNVRINSPAWRVDYDNEFACLLPIRSTMDAKLDRDMMLTDTLLMLLNSLKVLSYTQFYDDVYEIRIPMR